MRRYYVNNQGKLEVVQKPNQADQVLIDKTELDDLEKKLKNKTEEAARWRNKFNGVGLDYKLIKVDYIGDHEVYVTLSLPVPYQLQTKNQAKQLVETVFSAYINHKRRYRLHFAPLSGWSVNLLLNEEELDAFQLPNSEV